MWRRGLHDDERINLRDIARSRQHGTYSCRDAIMTAWKKPTNECINGGLGGKGEVSKGIVSISPPRSPARIKKAA